MPSALRRAYEHELSHRPVPWAVAHGAVVALARRAWRRDEQLREQARWHMRFLLGNAHPAGQFEGPARRYVEQSYVRMERIWRPWLGTKRPPQNVGLLSELRDGQRGVLISFMHHGDYTGHVGAIARSGTIVHFVANPELVTPTVTDQDSPYIRAVKVQAARTVTYRGGRILPAAGSRERIRALLLDGGVVALASDVPGSMTVSVLGREVQLAAGMVRLALDTGAWIVPMTVRPMGNDQRAALQNPIRPEEFDSPEALLAQVIHRHGDALLAWPEGLERPLRRWRPTQLDTAEFGWADGATFKI